MFEVELKTRADHDAVRDRLDAAGAERVATVRQVDTYYDAPHRDFAETDEALRVRSETVVEADDLGPEETRTETKLTYKGPLVEAESKTREERETAVDDADATAGIFAGLGFEPAATVEKDREFHRLDGYTVTLDDVSGLGEFVEVETEATADDIESAREGATATLVDLGLDPTDQIRTSYLGLLLDSQDSPNNSSR
ncbi:class IV adenylate cyclase [Halobaculum sp. CBA1158]|uniref:class IV adenylate cyclase n=1 Tax=Halobaculum sp. CBA1158 TaxID=2904243 RepID=UPI001F2AC151|nr:class IV adenylate cyclase [Halobaculum sp. CBA1158]UIO98856.1 class IV adenylate cyclase [Halobaculum sp. CBA1158]